MALSALVSKLELFKNMIPANNKYITRNLLKIKQFEKTKGIHKYESSKHNIYYDMTNEFNNSNLYMIAELNIPDLINHKDINKIKNIKFYKLQ